MAELTDEQRILLLANARKRKAQAEAEGANEPEKRGDFMSQVNKGLAGLVSGIPELILAGSRMQGRQTGKPGDITKAVESGFGAIGAPVAERPPETAAEFVGQVGGEAAAFALPFAKSAQLASGGTGALGSAARSLNRQLVERPIQTGLIETGAAGGAGLARNISEEQGFGPTASLAAEVGGGLAGAFTGSMPIQRGVGAVGRRLLEPFSEAGSFRRASERAREVVDDIPLALKNIEDLKGSNLQPSAKSQDPGLMNLEQTVASHDPALGTQMDKRTSDTVNALVNSIRESGSMKTTKDFLRAKVQRLKAAIDARVEIAGENARKAIDDMGDVATEADISMAQRESLDSALADAKVQEELLWRAVPVEAKTTTAGVKARYKKLQSELSKAQSDDMPAEARKLLGGSDESVQVESGILDLQGRPIMQADILTGRAGFSREETIKEMDGLYKRLGETARQARLASNNNKARIAEELREAILEDMGKIKGNREARESVATARAFSKDVNKKFSEGTVGRILGTKRGAAGVDPELTLGFGVGQGGLKGSLAAREIAVATGEDVTQLGAVQEFIKRKFLDAAMEDGVINPTKARNFIAKNPELMETYPHLRNQFATARSAEDASRTVKKAGDALRKRLDQPNISDVAKILNAPVDQEVKTIFTSSSPADAMQGIVNAVSKDKSGNAMKGLRAGVAEHMIDMVTSPSAFDVKNRPRVSGTRLKTLLTNENSRAAMSKVFNKKEMSNWDKVADQLVIAQRQMDKSGRSLDFIINDKSSYLVTLLAKFGGVKAASKLSALTGGGGSIQIPAMGSKLAQDTVKKLGADKAKQILIDAVTIDEDLLVSLLSKRSPAADKRFERIFSNYMIRSGHRLFNENEE